ncbi:MAG: ABC transporter substrate-binding protein, partial [Pseudomonadales bacterium]|nr:ABC transporter substrate-binding protein [Pseudomonadales bacterium]
MKLRLLLLSILGWSVAVQGEEPQYGGTLNVGTVSVTLSALSWDPADWAWKSNHDTGMVREQLFAGDLDKSVRRGGPYRFISDAYLPPESIRGELAESWEWEDPLTLVIHLREGVMFTELPGVMEARELVA